MSEAKVSGLCPLCSAVPSRTVCTLPGCKNSIAKPKAYKEVVLVGGPEEVRKQMEELSRFVKRTDESKK